MNLNLASRTFFATIVAALAGAGTLGLYQQMAQPGAEATAQKVVKLERVVVLGKRAQLGGDAQRVASSETPIKQLPRVVIEGRSVAPADARLVAAAAASCVSC